MERIQVTDEWLYRYMPIAAEAFIEDIEKLNEIVDQILSLSPRINPMD